MVPVEEMAGDKMLAKLERQPELHSGQIVIGRILRLNDYERPRSILNNKIPDESHLEKLPTS